MRGWEKRGPRRIDPRYLAGYVDGEGSLGIYKHTIRLSITNTYPNTLFDLQFHFGGKVGLNPRTNKAHRTAYQWQIFGAKAEAVIRTILPYLHEKRAQAEALLLYRTLDRNDSERKNIISQRVRDMKRVDHGKA